jgi:4'-phosphopantetheinyl transferase
VRADPAGRGPKNIRRGSVPQEGKHRGAHEHLWTLDAVSRNFPPDVRSFPEHGTGMRKPIFDLPDDYTISNDEVHVWLNRLELSTFSIHSFFDILSAEEKNRAASFRSAHDRDRHVIGRAMVRIIVGKLLGIRPNELPLQRDAYGKPIVPHQINTRDVRFNISHSGAFILVALSTGRSVGIDVERISEDFEFEAIAARFFSERERAYLAGMPQPERLNEFFRYWCRKEAYVKAQGAGLSYPFDQFDISAGAVVPLLRTQRERAEAGCWEIRDIDVGPCYAAALAVEGTDFTVKLCQAPASHRHRPEFATDWHLHSVLS